MIDAKETMTKLVLNIARYGGIAPLAAPFMSGVGAILMLHHVNRDGQGALGFNSHLTVTPEFLDDLLTDLKRAGYAFVCMDEAIERVNQGRRGRFVAVTADDAYRDNMTDALPVLESHDAPITIYVAPGLINHEVDLWWELLEDVIAHSEVVKVEAIDGNFSLDCRTPNQKCSVNMRLHHYLTNVVAEEERQAILRALAEGAGIDHARPSRDRLLNWEELRCMSAHRLVTLGAHSVSHYNLRRLSEEDAYREIADAARIIGFEIGVKPRHMAYPYGYESAVGPREVRLAGEAGYVSAVTTRHGVLQRQHAQHLHALPRISLNGRYQKPAHIRTMLSGVTTALANAGRRVVTV